MKDRINSIEEYFKGFNIAEGLAYITILFPPKWQIPDGNILEETFKVKSAIENDGSIYFYTSLENGVDTLFDAVDFTIEFNKDLEEKTKLFKEKMDELKRIFIEKTLDEVKTLSFSFTENKNKSKRKNSKKQKENEKKTVDISVETKDEATVDTHPEYLEAPNHVVIGEPDGVINDKQDDKDDDDSLINYAKTIIEDK